MDNRVFIACTPAQLEVISKQLDVLTFFSAKTGNHYNGTHLVLRPSDVATITALNFDRLPVDLARPGKIAELRAACDAQIVSGFHSMALGADHFYPNAVVDQHNLAASVMASLMPGIDGSWTTRFWCLAGGGVWALTEHTAAQIQTVAIDAKAAVVSAQQRLANLTAEVASAGTTAMVNSINW